ncbi:MAG: CBS domain-containing protein [Acidobacteriota bacterium]
MSGTVASILENKGHAVHRIGPDETVFDAIGKMVRNNVGSLLVMDGDRIVGILTERDYLRRVALEGRSSRTTPVREIMTLDVVYVGPQHTIEDCMAIMTARRIRHLPVIDEGRLVGLVSQGDLVKRLAADRQVEIETLRDYIAGSYPG